jgi:hypothetical protein
MNFLLIFPNFGVFCGINREIFLANKGEVGRKFKKKFVIYTCRLGLVRVLKSRRIEWAEYLNLDGGKCIQNFDGNVP